MGLSSLPLVFLLASAPPLGATALPPVALPMSLETFETVLQEGDISQLSAACADADRFGLQERLRLLRDRLMLVAPSPQPFAVVMANARALLACKAPDSTQIVLSRYGPGPGLQRREWLLLSWQAASAALDQDRAVLALRRLADGDFVPMDRILFCCDWLLNSGPEVSGRNFSAANDLIGKNELTNRLKFDENFYKLRRYGNSE